MATLLALGDYWWDWGNLLFRWLHVIAAIAWIGASFYFIALDNHLRPPPTSATPSEASAARRGRSTAAASTASRSSGVAPAPLPEPLHWFKWEAYTTWLSGFALLVVVYYAHASTYLVDPIGGRPLDWQAIAISRRRARRSPGSSTTGSAGCSPDASCALAGAGARVHRARGVGRRASSSPPRAAYVQVGAMIGTIMVGERLLRDHPGALGARPRKAGGARARPALERARQAAVGAQQLPDAAGACSRC